jgi:hypothetical protein
MPSAADADHRSSTYGRIVRELDQIERVIMGDRVLILRRDHPLDFVAEVCAVLADSLNEIHVTREGETLLVDTYAEMLCAYSNLLRPGMASDPGCATQLNVIDHLVERLGQTRAGEIRIPLLDIADRLHAELVRQPLPV